MFKGILTALSWRSSLFFNIFHAFNNSVIFALVGVPKFQYFSFLSLSNIPLRLCFSALHSTDLFVSCLSHSNFSLCVSSSVV